MTTPDFTYGEPIAIAAEGKTAPEWVQLFPAGPELRAIDGRRWRLSDPRAVVLDFEARGRDLPIDVEHAIATRAKAGLAAPAYGWIKALEVRDGAIWGRVEWHAQAKEWIENKQYRFISPGFGYDPRTLEVRRLKHAGLVNDPAFEMAALARESAQQETVMDPTVLKELGLPEGATAAQAVAAIGALREEVATAKAADPDPTQFVPMEQLAAANAKIAELEGDATAREAQAIAAALDAAVSAGKIAPASRAHFEKTAEALGLAGFNELVAGLPVIAGKSGLKADDKTKAAGVAGLTDEDLAVCRQFGGDPEALAKFKEEEA